MKTLGTRIIATRGEVFTFAREIRYQNGAPYVLRSQLENPYLLIAVSSNTYRLEGKYLKNYWLDLSTYPKFDKAEVKDINESQFENNVLPLGYTENTCIYRLVTSTGGSEYYRYVGKSSSGSYESYSFNFAHTFLNADTREWIESNYQYEVRIVSGKTTREYLTETFNSLFPNTEVPELLQDIYDKINEVRPDLLTYVSVSAPIVNYITNTIIIPPSILTVKANV